MLKFHKDYADRPRYCQRFNARKHHWSQVKLPVTLEVTPCSLDQLDPTTNTIFASYNYKDIDGIIGALFTLAHFVELQKCYLFSERNPRC